MKTVLSLIVLLSFVGSAHSQIDTESIPPYQDQRDLFIRAAESRIVVVGTVVKSEGRSERIAPEELRERLMKGTVHGGSLITVQVEEIVCRQSDFDGTMAVRTDPPQPFYLFVPFDQLKLPDGQYREELLPKRQYLLVLTDVDSRAAIARYELEPDRIYYRGAEHNRGVIPLEPETRSGKTQNPPEVVDEFRKLCTAMRPPKLEDKMALLQQLKDSADPILQKEAEEAQKAVRKQMEDAAEKKQESQIEPK